MAHAPTVIVSSTFYDLKYLRQHLGAFLIEELGYAALLSELPSFPVNPDLDTIANCVRRVEDDADCLVLVVGGRYGSIDDRSAKSITNLEYLAARRKGIPMFAFVENRILSILPVWKRNPNADYSDVVDTTELFRFVETIRDEDKTWVFPFESAQDIIKTLRIQLAHLFLEGLRFRLRLRGAGTPSYYQHAGPQTLQIALERPKGWEYLLFVQSWLDEIARRSWALRDYKSQVAVGISEDVPADAAGEWLMTRFHELSSLVRVVGHLVNVEAAQSFGERGQPGDADHILWTTRKIGEVLDAALDWSHRLRLARVHEPFGHVVAAASAFAGDVIEQLVSFPEAKLAEVNRALEIAASGSPQTVEWTLTIKLPNVDKFNAALAEARQRMGMV